MDVTTRNAGRSVFGVEEAVEAAPLSFFLLVRCMGFRVATFALWKNGCRTSSGVPNIVFQSLHIIYELYVTAQTSG